jgi:outer membrane protein
MRNILFIIQFFFCCVLSFSASAQINTKSYTLEEVISQARIKSADALLAKHQFRNSYWQYRTYKASRLPFLSMNSTLPDFNRSIGGITQPDGSIIYKSQYQSSSSINFSLTQNVGFSGGQLFVNSGLERIDLLGDTRSTSYLSSPLYLGVSQPVFGYNAFKWDKKIEPLKYKEAESKYIESMEQLAIRATNLFFDLLLAEINLEIAELNQANNDTIYKITRGRYNYGKIAENELLQMELALLNSNNKLEEARLNVQIAAFALKSFLGMKTDEDLTLQSPVHLHHFKVEYPLALEQALENRAASIGFERQLLEAQSELQKVKADNRISVDVYAMYGLTQSAPDIESAYQDMQDQQKLMLGLQMPIIDWGLSKGKVKMAESNKELVSTRVEQSKTDFKKEVYLKVMQFNMQSQQLMIAAKADTIGQKRFEVSKQRYLIGKIDITELNIAQEEKDLARKAYISSLRSFWNSYFEIRKLTLYDFLKNEKIAVDFDSLQ